MRVGDICETGTLRQLDVVQYELRRRNCGGDSCFQYERYLLPPAGLDGQIRPCLRSERSCGRTYISDIDAASLITVNSASEAN